MTHPMKKPMHILKTACVLLGATLVTPAAADDLVSVYRQALDSDPTFPAAGAG